MHERVGSEQGKVPTALEESGNEVGRRLIVTEWLVLGEKAAPDLIIRANTFSVPETAFLCAGSVYTVPRPLMYAWP